MNTFDVFFKKIFEPLSGTDIVVFIIQKQRIFSKKWFQRIFYSAIFHLMSTKGKFSLIYDKNLWNETSSASGHGATLEATESIRSALPDIFKELEIRNVLDIPCGDFNWMQHVDMKDINYTGADIVDELIEKNNQQFASTNRRFLVFDIINNHLPKVDLIICRDGLVHLTDKEIKKTIKNIKKSNSKYLLTTSFPGKNYNAKIGNNRWRTLNLEKTPFNFPKPLMHLAEKESACQYGEKNLCLWLIENI
jgi:SAM-dependent methyltransferase